MNNTTRDAVIIADRDMRPRTKDALKDLTDAVEAWGATVYHQHITDVRQEVETGLTSLFDDLQLQIESDLERLETYVEHLIAALPGSDVARELQRATGDLRMHYAGAVEQRRHLTAEGL